MSESTDGTRVYIAQVRMGDDGRIVSLEILPDPELSDEDPVLAYSQETGKPVWRQPSEMGFSATPMIMDVPITDGFGFILTDGEGAILTCNVPYV